MAGKEHSWLGLEADPGYHSPICPSGWAVLSISQPEEAAPGPGWFQCEVCETLKGESVRYINELCGTMATKINRKDMFQ